MPEVPNSSDTPPSPEETAEFTEAEWTDDSSYQTLEIPAVDTTVTPAAKKGDELTQEQNDAAEFTEAEWTDDSSYQTLETPATDITVVPATNEVDEVIPAPDNAVEFPEAEWTDDSSYQAIETSATNTPVAPVADEGNEAVPEPDGPAGFPEAEWTDDSSYQMLATSATEAETTSPARDEWDEATQEWEDELAELPEPEPQPPTTKEALSWIQPVWQKFRRLWQRLMAGVRNRIPAAAQLSDTVLSAILVGVLVLLLVLLNGVRQPSVASSSPSPEPRNTDLPAASPIDRSPDLTPMVDETTEPVPSSVPQSPPDASSLEPGYGDRIAKIQTQMIDSSILNAQRVVDSVQADFTQNELTLVLNGDWYRLSDYDQTQLAQALMQQSQGLAFSNLEFVSSTGELLARSPVVGTDMVILQRERPPEVPEPERPRFRVMLDR